MQVGHIVSLMRCNIDVAIVTAAGYPGEPHRFEQRMAGLLAAFRRLRLPRDVTDRSTVQFCPQLSHRSGCMGCCAFLRLECCGRLVPVGLMVGC